MSYRDHRSGVLFQVLLEPGDGAGVEVVGWLVEEEDVRLLQEEAAEGDPAAFPPGEHPGRSVAGRAAESVHGHIQPAVQVPGAQSLQLLLDFSLLFKEGIHLLIRHGLREFLVDPLIFLEEADRALDPFLHDFPDRLRIIQPGLLFKEADGVPGGKNRLPNELFVGPGEDPEKRALPGAVESDHADLGAVEVREGNILQDGLLVVKFADSDHGVNHFIRFVNHSSFHPPGNTKKSKVGKI